jgi:toxin ParE1/3/4
MAQINWTDQANKDIEIIVNFLAPQSETYAKIQIQRIFEKVDLLANMPRLGRIVPELEYKNVRELIIGSYRIV